MPAASRVNVSTGSVNVASKYALVTATVQTYCFRMGPATSGATSSACSDSVRLPRLSWTSGRARTLCTQPTFP